METQHSEKIVCPQISQEDSDRILSKLTLAGKLIIPDFEISEEQKPYYLNLGLYFKNDPACKWDLKKGLMICGDKGTGKTLSMTIMRGLFKNFGMIATRYLIREYLSSDKPALVLNKYGVESLIPNPTGVMEKEKPLNWFFDDLGLENINTKNFGNQINVMEEILMDRYDMFISHGMKTYATTNLNGKAIEECYGGRVLDRMVEIMNYITLTGTSKRK